MILSYKNKALKLLLNEGISRGLPPELAKKIRYRLEAINSVTNPNQLRGCLKSRGRGKKSSPGIGWNYSHSNAEELCLYPIPVI